MTRMEALLERAADSGPIGFDTGDVRRRVQRRRRVRHSVGAVAAVLLLVGVAAAAREALDRQDRQAVVYGESDLVSPIAGRWVPIASSGVSVSSGGVYLEIRDDGTLGGYDGCNDFGGHWRLDGSRLVVTRLAGDGEDCGSGPDPQLQRILADDPTAGPADGSPETLELRSPEGFITFGEADQIDTELMTDVAGGETVKVTFRTPRHVESGAERELAAWTAVTSADHRVSVWAAVAIDGLPAECRLESVHRWEELERDIAAGSPPTTPRVNLEPGQGGQTSVLRRDIPATCAGNYEMVLLSRSAFDAASDITMERVPITIR